MAFKIRCVAGDPVEVDTEWWVEVDDVSADSVKLMCRKDGEMEQCVLTVDVEGVHRLMLNKEIEHQFAMEVGNDLIRVPGMEVQE